MTDQELRAAFYRATGNVSAYHHEAYQAFRKGVEFEREECAKLCESIGIEMTERYGDGAECLTTSAECAENIRKRSNAKIEESPLVGDPSRMEGSA
jgi:hypothetical protein